MLVCLIATGLATAYYGTTLNSLERDQRTAANIDPLTGLLNRAALAAHFEGLRLLPRAGVQLPSRRAFNGRAPSRALACAVVRPHARALRTATKSPGALMHSAATSRFPR